MTPIPNVLRDDPFEQALRAVLEQRRILTQPEAHACCHLLLTEGIGQRETRVAALLGALAARGETPGELAGFAQAMRAAATPIPLTASERETLVDSCGTGGDGAQTFNISTAAALVAAAAGATVAKHGNRAVTSRCGSADVLEELGVHVNLTPEQAVESLRRHRFAFLAAPVFQPAMRHLAPLRRALGIRTLFNLLGPMTNPAGARAQVIGVYGAHLVSIVAQTLALLDTRHALVVHGQGLDEITTAGETLTAEVKLSRITHLTLTPEHLKLPRTTPTALQGGSSAAENAAILRQIFSGASGPRRDIVLANAAAVLLTAELTPDLPTGVLQASEAIDSGKVQRLLRNLTQSDRPTTIF